MQDERGLKGLLRHSRLFSAFQELVGGPHALRWLLENHVQLAPGEKLLDVGCGPGQALDLLPAGIHYVGFDLNEDYVRSVQARGLPHVTALHGTAADFLAQPPQAMCDVDCVLCVGILHHLDDGEALDVLRLARRVLKPAGRLVIIEPTYLAHQTRASRWVMARDRGQNIRRDGEWRALAGQVFEQVHASVVTGLLRLPYIHIVLECRP